MKTQQLIGSLLIHNLLSSFMQSFDDHNWQQMRACLADSVYCDYSTSFRGTPPATISGDQYVAQRQSALPDLAMQHNFFNLQVTFDDQNVASARCNYIIHRFHPTYPDDPTAFFHSYGHYDFGFQKIDGDWEISRITQHLLRNQGNPNLHGTTRNT